MTLAGPFPPLSENYQVLFDGGYSQSLCFAEECDLGLMDNGVADVTLLNLGLPGQSGSCLSFVALCYLS